MKIQKSTSVYDIPFLLVLASDSKSPATGKSPTVTIRKNGGAFAPPAGAVTEIANGWYTIAGNATDSNTLGALLVHVSEASSDNTDDRHEVVAEDLTTAVVARVTLTDTVTTYTGNTPQTGDAYARLGAAGAGLTALGDARIREVRDRGHEPHECAHGRGSHCGDEGERECGSGHRPRRLRRADAHAAHDPRADGCRCRAGRDRDTT